MPAGVSGGSGVSQRQLRIIISVVSNAKTVVAQTKQHMSGLHQALIGAQGGFKGIMAVASKASMAFAAVGVAVSALMSVFNLLAKLNPATIFQDIGRAAFYAVVQVVAVFRAVQSMMDPLTELEAKLREISALISTQMNNAWAKTLDIWGDISKLGDHVGKSILDLAGGMRTLVAAGYDANEAMLVLSASADLATAFFSNTARAVEVLMPTLRAYGTASAEAGKIASQLFFGAAIGRFELEDLGSGFAEATSWAAQLGVGLTELLSVLVELTGKGQNAERVAIGLMNVMRESVRPANDSRIALKALKSIHKDLTFEFGREWLARNGLLGLIQQMEKLTVSEIATIFRNVRSLRVVIGTMGQYGRLLEMNNDILNDTTALSRAVDEAMQSLSMRMQLAKNALLTLANVAFAPLLEDMKKAADFIAAFAKSMRDNMTPEMATRMSNTVKVLVAFFGVFGPLSILVNSMAMAMLKLVIALPVFEKLYKWFFAPMMKGIGEIPIFSDASYKEAMERIHSGVSVGKQLIADTLTTIFHLVHRNTEAFFSWALPYLRVQLFRLIADILDQTIKGIESLGPMKDALQKQVGTGEQIKTYVQSMIRWMGKNGQSYDSPREAMESWAKDEFWGAPGSWGTPTLDEVLGMEAFGKDLPYWITHVEELETALSGARGELESMSGPAFAVSKWMGSTFLKNLKMLSTMMSGSGVDMPAAKRLAFASMGNIGPEVANFFMDVSAEELADKKQAMLDTFVTGNQEALASLRKIWATAAVDVRSSIQDMLTAGMGPEGSKSFMEQLLGDEEDFGEEFASFNVLYKGLSKQIETAKISLDALAPGMQKSIANLMNPDPVIQAKAQDNITRFMKHLTDFRTAYEEALETGELPKEIQSLWDEYLSMTVQETGGQNVVDQIEKIVVSMNKLKSVYDFISKTRDFRSVSDFIMGNDAVLAKEALETLESWADEVPGILLSIKEMEKSTGITLPEATISHLRALEEEYRGVNKLVGNSLRDLRSLTKQAYAAEADLSRVAPLVQEALATLLSEDPAVAKRSRDTIKDYTSRLEDLREAVAKAMEIHGLPDYYKNLFSSLIPEATEAVGGQGVLDALYKVEASLDKAKAISDYMARAQQVQSLYDMVLGSDPILRDQAREELQSIVDQVPEIIFAIRQLSDLTGQPVPEGMIEKLMGIHEAYNNIEFFFDTVLEGAQQVGQALSSSLGDFFANVFTGQVDSAAQAFEQLKNSAMSAISMIIQKMLELLILIPLFNSLGGMFGMTGGGLGDFFFAGGAAPTMGGKSASMLPGPGGWPMAMQPQVNVTVVDVVQPSQIVGLGLPANSQIVVHQVLQDHARRGQTYRQMKGGA